MHKPVLSLPTLSMDSPPMSTLPNTLLSNQLAATPPTPSPDDAPAPWGAGGPRECERRKRPDDEHLEAAVLVTRLEVLKKMYKELIKRSVGTNVIESEVMRMVKERVSGPTGHRLLEIDSERISKEHVSWSEDTEDGLHCWRDQRSVRKMTGLRLREVKCRLKDTRKSLAGQMRYITKTRTKLETRTAWEEVRSIRRETWVEDNRKHERKVEHLTRRSSDCNKHRACREVDKIWNEGCRNVRMYQEEVVKSTLEESTPSVLPETEAQECDPNIQVKSVYKSKPEDLETLDAEEEKVHRMSQGYNKLWKVKPDILEDEEKSEVVTHGNVTLTEPEIDLLRLGPGFMVVSDLDREEMEVEAGVTMTKIRWSKRSRGVEDLTGRQAEMEEKEYPVTEEEQSLTERLEAESRDVLNNEGDEIDMGRKRCTDMRNNRNVRMPAPGPPAVEAEMNTRVGTWRKSFMNFRENNCNKDGVQNQSNLSPNQLLGMKTLLKKVAKLEAIVLEADKGKRFVIVDEATYLEMANDHISGDSPTTPDEVKKSQRILTATAKAIGNVTSLGMKHSRSNYVRCMDNLGSEALDVPTLKLLVKIHKPMTDGGYPQSRPVVAAASGISSRAGDAVADLLEPMVLAELPRMEDISTEEVIAQLEEAEIEIRDGGYNDTMVGSLDVCALYPSLDQEESVKMVGKFVMESKV